MLKRIVRLLKDIGIIKMTHEELLERIPKDSLSFEQIKTEVTKIGIGETRTFNFDPRDEAFNKYQNIVGGILTFARGRPLLVNYHVLPRKGRYTLEISVG